MGLSKKTFIGVIFLFFSINVKGQNILCEPCVQEFINTYNSVTITQMEDHLGTPCDVYKLEGNIGMFTVQYIEEFVPGIGCYVPELAPFSCQLDGGIIWQENFDSPPNCNPNPNHTNFSFYSGPLVSPLSGSNEPCLSYPRKYEFNLGDNVQLYTSITMNQQPLKFRFHTIIEDKTGSTQDYYYPATYIELLAGQCANFTQYITTDIVGVYTVYNYVIYEDGTESDPPYDGYTYTFEVKQIEAPVCDTEVEIIQNTPTCKAVKVVSTGEIFKICGIANGLPTLPPVGFSAKIAYNIDTGCAINPFCYAAYSKINIVCIEPSTDVQFILPSKNVNYLDTFSIPVTVIGFKDIIGFRFPVTWDSTKLEYIKVHSLNKKLPDFNNNRIEKLENYPIVICSYPSPFELTINLPISDTLFFIQFRALKNVCDSSFLSVLDSLPVIEIINPQTQLLSFSITNSKVKQNAHLCNNCTHPDYAPLIALYNSTNGPGWMNNEGWKEGAAGASCDPCNGWYGVFCKEGRVDRLFLHLNNLRGYIPPDVGNLSQLEQLVLNDNQISGKIPNQIGFMQNLTRIWLSKNAFTGSIPKEIKNLNKLKELDLAFNEFSGSIPPELCELHNLTILILTVNQLTGTIPDSIGKLKNLEGLILDHNNLDGQIPETIGNLSNLTSLDLGSNQLTGSVPLSIGNLTKLINFEIAKNQIIGEIPPVLSNLPNLLNVKLDSNQLSGCFPPWVCNIQYFSSKGNAMLPWEGEHTIYCDGTGQSGATCNDGNSNTINDKIQDDCSCRGQQPCVITNFNITHTTCGLDNGSIVIDDPNRDFEVKWQNNVSTEREFKNLKAGSYSIEISLGSCVRDTTIIINSSTVVAAEANVFHTKCGQNNGSITLSNVPSNIHKYLWSNSTTNATLSNVSALGGTYSVTITRNNDGCKDTIQGIKVNSSETLSIIPMVTQPSCNLNNGMIELPSVIGYTYNWGNNNQRVRNNLAPGTYSYTVTDLIGCTATGSVQLDPSPSLNATINITREPTCKDGDGAVIITPYSNNPDEYSYQWSDILVSGHNPTYLRSDTEYKVTVTRKSDNCTDVRSIPPQKKYNPSVSINSTRTLINCFDPGPILLTLNINNKDTLENTYLISEYRWSTNEQLTSVTIKPVATTTYTVTIFDSNGCSATAQQEIKVDQQKPGADIQAQDGTIINCYKPTLNISANLLVGSPSGSYNYLWNNGNSNASINAGQAGTYSVIITSQQNGCNDTAQVVIGSYITKPDFTLKQNGKLTCIRLRDTLDINIDNKSLYQYLWVNTQLETLPRIVNNPGTYQLAVTNIENGCKENKNFTVNEDKLPPTVELEITPDLLTCEKDSATIRVLADGNKKYAYQWFNDKTGPIIHVKDTATISVLVTDLSNGCQNTGKGYVGIDTNQIVGAYCGDPFNFDYRFIQDDCSCKQGCASIHIDEYDDQLITLRGDGYFRLPLANLFESNELTIVNRWGQAVYKKSGYVSNSDEGWRGQIFDTGDFVPDGAYYFSIDLQPGQKGCRFAGSITIIR